MVEVFVLYRTACVQLVQQPHPCQLIKAPSSPLSQSASSEWHKALHTALYRRTVQRSVCGLPSPAGHNYSASVQCSVQSRGCAASRNAYTIYILKADLLSFQILPFVVTFHCVKGWLCLIFQISPQCPGWCCFRVPFIDPPTLQPGSSRRSQLSVHQAAGPSP